MAVVVTRHAQERIKNRVCRKSNKQAEKSLSMGITHAEAKGSLSRYLDRLYLNGNNPNNIRIYGRSVFLFHNRTLITVLELPKKYYKICDKLVERRESIANA